MSVQSAAVRWGICLNSASCFPGPCDLQNVQYCAFLWNPSFHPFGEFEWLLVTLFQHARHSYLIKSFYFKEMQAKNNSHEFAFVLRNSRSGERNNLCDVNILSCSLEILSNNICIIKKTLIFMESTICVFPTDHMVFGLDVLVIFGNRCFHFYFHWTKTRIKIEISVIYTDSLIPFFIHK